MNCYYFYCPNAFEYLQGTYYTNVWADTPEEAKKKCQGYVGVCYLLKDRPKNVEIGYLY